MNTDYDGFEVFVVFRGNSFIIPGIPPNYANLVREITKLFQLSTNDQIKITYEDDEEGEKLIRNDDMYRNSLTQMNGQGISLSLTTEANNPLYSGNNQSPMLNNRDNRQPFNTNSPTKVIRTDSTQSFLTYRPQHQNPLNSPQTLAYQNNFDSPRIGNHIPVNSQDQYQPTFVVEDPVYESTIPIQRSPERSRQRSNTGLNNSRSPDKIPNYVRPGSDAFQNGANNQSIQQRNQMNGKSPNHPINPPYPPISIPQQPVVQNILQNNPIIQDKFPIHARAGSGDFQIGAINQTIQQRNQMNLKPQIDPITPTYVPHQPAVQNIPPIMKPVIKQDECNCPNKAPPQDMKFTCGLCARTCKLHENPCPTCSTSRTKKLDVMCKTCGNVWQV